MNAMTSQDILARLPEITDGSPKQIAWAKQLREQWADHHANGLRGTHNTVFGTDKLRPDVRAIEKRLARLAVEARGGSRSEYREAWKNCKGESDPAELWAEFVSLFDRAIALLDNAHEAKWWIENRTANFLDTIRSGIA